MPVTDVSHDLDARTLTIVADFAGLPKRIWEVYADPRQLERIWGPPTYPATFVDHDLVPGGRMNYYMTSPEGEKYYGYWEVETVDEPNNFTFDDGFALDEEFTKNSEMYDVIFDAVGKHSFRRSRDSLKSGGMYVPTDGWENLFYLLWTSRVGDRKVVFQRPPARGNYRSSRDPCGWTTCVLPAAAYRPSWGRHHSAQGSTRGTHRSRLLRPVHQGRATHPDP